MKKINNKKENLNKIIKVSEQTVNKLKEIGKMSETYNDVICKLIDANKK